MKPRRMRLRNESSSFFYFAVKTRPIMETNKKGVIEVDEMKLNLSTKFMRGILAKLISRKIKKQYGYKIDIHFSEINFDMVDGQTHLHVNADVDLSSDEFKKIMKAIDED